MPQRPDNFRIDRRHYLAKGLAFAGLGAMAGSTLYADSSLYSKHGTCSAAASNYPRWTYTLGRNALSFDGSTNYQRITLSNAAYSGSCVGYSLWCTIYTGAFNDFQSIIETATYPTNSILFGSTSGRIELYGSVTYTLPSAHINSGIPHHLFLSLNNGYASWYYDGQLVAGPTAKASPYTFKASLVLGERTATGRPFKGNIIDPMVYTNASVLAHIDKLADPSNVMLSGLILPPARKWWPVVSGGGPAASTIPVFMHHRRLMGAA